MANVFLVDDHPDVREVMGNLLEMHGHIVQVIGSGERALERLALERPDVLIADHRLPGINGIELLTQIRNNPRLQALKCVLFSADDTLRESAQSAGAEFWLKGSDTLFDSIARLGESINGHSSSQASGKPHASS